MNNTGPRLLLSFTVLFIFSLAMVWTMNSSAVSRAVNRRARVDSYASPHPSNAPSGLVSKRFGSLQLYSSAVVASDTQGINAWNSNGPLNTESFLCLAIDPGNARIIYAGVSHRGIGDSGVYKSLDGGASWNPAGLHRAYVTALAIDPSSPNSVYAAASSDFTGGIYKSLDGGVSWTLTGYKFSALSLAINPRQPNTIYAGTSFGVYKSTDGGANWNRPNPSFDPSIPDLQLDPNNPQIVYVATPNGGVYRSADGGSTWNRTATIDRGSSHPTIAIDPSNSNVLYATYGDIYKTTNAGGTWSKINNNLADPSASVVAIDPSNPNTVYVGTYSYGGVMYKSTNGGASWSAFTVGLPQKTVWSLAIDRTGTFLHTGLEYGGVFDYQYGQPSPPNITITASAQGKSVSNDGILELTVPPGGLVSVNLDASINPGSGAVKSLNWQSNASTISTQPSFTYQFGRGQFGGSYLIGLTVENSDGLKKTVGIGIVVKETQSLPDLTIMASPAGIYSPGQTAQVPVTVKRSGGSLVIGTFVLARLYWSNNSTLDNADIQLWQSNGNTDFLNNVLNSSGTQTVSAAITVPANATLGQTYYLLAVADADNYYQENDEANNTAVSQVTVRSQVLSLVCWLAP